SFRHFVDMAHGEGLLVLLDVVYNHFGPEGNYLGQYAAEYFTDKYKTPWGGAINYEGCPWARRLALDNVRYWLEEFRVDGFRLDATFAIHDASPKHLLREIAETARAAYPGAILIAETHENDPRYLSPEGYDFDAVWADDFHHTIRRRVAGDHEGYYGDYAGDPPEIARTINQGFLFEGQASNYSGEARGHPARRQPAWQFVYCIQNHDQVGNRAFGDRLSHDIGLDQYRLVSFLLLLLPQTPMLFMGQEFASRSPFQYFTDHSGDLGELVTKGRREEFRHFAAFSSSADIQKIPDPQAHSTFDRSKLNWQEADNAPGREVFALYRDLLHLRIDDSVLSRRSRQEMEARAVGEVLVLSLGHGRRVVLANFSDRSQSVDLETLGLEGPFRSLLDSNDGRYGGSGKRMASIGGSTVEVDSHSGILLAMVDTSG
ncbi:MAG: DUF3459 domain-containing protein, partial [Chloroflexi bacterium]|nr:DUF3459 domain-containing protein [Chloroflexota bacterium]